MEHVDPSVVVVKPVRAWSEPIAFAAMVAVLVVAPAFAYPVFLMKALCFALFACAFNLLIGYVGLPSFGLISLADQMTMYGTVLVIFLGGFLLIYRIIHSPFGEVLKAIRENEARAISLGYKTDRYKLEAFVLSATFAGVAGATKAIVFQLASLTDVNWPMSGEVVLMTLVGGLGTVFGPVVGAFVIIAMQTYLAQVGQWVSVIQG